MEWEQIEDHWDDYKAKVSDQWPKLTKEDLEGIDGSKEELAGFLSQRYGYPIVRADNEIAAFLSSLKVGKFGMKSSGGSGKTSGSYSSDEGYL